MANKQKSWVAKWQRMDNYAMGTYAVKVVGTVSQGLASDGITRLTRRPA